MSLKVAWLHGRALADIQGAAGGLLLGAPPAAEAQVRPPTQRTKPEITIQDRARLPTPPRRGCVHDDQYPQTVRGNGGSHHAP
jgi:hypothetical protein